MHNVAIMLYSDNMELLPKTLVFTIWLIHPALIVSLTHYSTTYEIQITEELDGLEVVAHWFVLDKSTFLLRIRLVNSLEKWVKLLVTILTLDPMQHTVVDRNHGMGIGVQDVEYLV